jgi:hypothetical protein
MGLWNGEASSAPDKPVGRNPAAVLSAVDGRRRLLSRYLRLGDGKLVSFGWIETSVELVAEALGFCCFGFLASRLPRC